jgi:hypothetical protein
VATATSGVVVAALLATAHAKISVVVGVGSATVLVVAGTTARGAIKALATSRAAAEATGKDAVENTGAHEPGGSEVG